MSLKHLGQGQTPRRASQMSATFSLLPLSKLYPGPHALPRFSVLNSLFQDSFSNLSLLHQGCSLSWEQQ